MVAQRYSITLDEVRAMSFKDVTRALALIRADNRVQEHKMRKD